MADAQPRCTETGCTRPPHTKGSKHRDGQQTWLTGARGGLEVAPAITVTDAQRARAAAARVVELEAQLEALRAHARELEAQLEALRALERARAERLAASTAKTPQA